MVPATRSASWKWWITGLLLLATMVNYMDRQTLSGMAPRIKTELGIGDTSYGELEMAFGLSFAAGSLVFGWLADRVKVFWLYPLVLMAWSIMGMVTGWARDVQELMVCRALLGFFEAGHWPCALKTTHAVLTQRDRTLGNSILQSGASVGAIFTPQIIRLSLGSEAGAWREIFFAIGAGGLLWVLLWFVSIRRTDLEQVAGERTTNSMAPALSLAEIVTSRRAWAVALLLVGPQIAWHICRAWLQIFLQSGRGYTESEALNFSSLFYLAADAGCLLGGAAALWFAKRGLCDPHMARRRVYRIACCLTSLCVALPWLGKGWAGLATLLLIAAGALAMFPCYYGFVQDLSPHHVGKLTGILSAFGWVVMSPVQPLFGMLKESTGSYDAGLVITGFLPWLGVLSMALLWPRDSEAKDERSAG